MKFRKALVISLLALSIPFTGCSNIFSGLAKTDTDEALFEDAQKLINDKDWANALAKFEAMSPVYQAKTEVVEAWAATYAGKCGLDFISYFTDLGSATLTGSTILRYLSSVWAGDVVSAPDCTLAQLKMEEISSNPANRTAEQNLFLAILGMVKMGVYLRIYIDKDGAGGLGDGTPDAGVNVCTDDVSNLPNAGLDEFITGFGLLTSNLAYLTEVLSAGTIEDALNQVNSVCSDPNVPAGTCGKTDPSTISDSDRSLFRDLLKTAPGHPSVPLGVGDCVTDDPTTGFLVCCP